MLSRSETRIGALCAIVGSVLLFVGTYLHPLEANLNEAVAAFIEYAADHLWVASHLTQLVGVALMVDTTYPKWLAGLALVGGMPTTVAGVVIAYTGFSGLAMAINMPASSLVLVWMLALGVFMWHRGGGPPDEMAG